MKSSLDSEFKLNKSDFQVKNGCDLEFMLLQGNTNCQYLLYKKVMKV
jgi:hypothetical protein